MGAPYDLQYFADFVKSHDRETLIDWLVAHDLCYREDCERQPDDVLRARAEEAAYDLITGRRAGGDR